MISREVVVIGGGPSGLAAAIEAARRGADVLVVDSNLKAGGQLFKQIHKFFGSSAHRAGTERDGHREEEFLTRQRSTEWRYGWGA